MVTLTKAMLIKKLKQINIDPKTRDIHNSKLDRIVNFLKKTTGYRIAAVKEGGSGGKQTAIRTSDIDVIFTTNKDKDKKKMINDLLKRAKKGFGKGVNVHASSNAVHIDYNNPRCNIDLVYKTKQEFHQEKNKIKEIKKLRSMYKNAIKLAKYALYKAKINDIHGYEVELACMRSNDNNLVDCVTNSIKYFTGRIKQHGITVNQVLQRLT